MKNKASDFKITRYSNLCCPHKGYRGDTVYAAIRASDFTRYVFVDGRTLTVGPKTRYATFPSTTPLNAIVKNAQEEFAEQFPRTRNLYVEMNGSAIAPLNLKS